MFRRSSDSEDFEDYNLGPRFGALSSPSLSRLLAVRLVSFSFFPVLLVNDVLFVSFFFLLGQRFSAALPADLAPRGCIF